MAAHHGSLSRKLRLNAEEKLKTGRVKALVATASLELGIDVGTVDLVIQIGSPRSIAVSLQRVGRSGHWRGATPKGRFFATTRDELLECAALVRSIREGELDRLIIPDSPLDILAQQIVAACAVEEWDEDELFAMLRRAYSYRDLSRENYERVLEMLSEGIAARRGRYGAYIHRDQVNRKLRARRGSRLAAITSGGAIPETALFTVVRRAGRSGRRDARRRLRGREQRRRHHAAGKHFVANSPRGRQIRPRAGGRRARRAAECSVLARRGSSANRRTFRQRWGYAKTDQRDVARRFSRRRLAQPSRNRGDFDLAKGRIRPG